VSNEYDQLSSASPPDVDGMLEVKGPYGKSVLLVALSEGLNFEVSAMKIGQKRYTIAIREISPGSDITDPQETMLHRIMGTSRENPQGDGRS
jgi:hypothetical protein